MLSVALGTLDNLEVMCGSEGFVSILYKYRDLVQTLLLLCPGKDPQCESSRHMTPATES